jgi:ABC-2 type transport system ATP-binding protein
VLGRALDAPVRLEADPAALSGRISADAAANGGAERLGAALVELSRSGIAVAELALGQPSLDEVFLSLTGDPAQNNTATEEVKA